MYLIISGLVNRVVKWPTLLSFDDITSSWHDFAVAGVESCYGFSIPFGKGIHEFDVGCLDFCLQSCNPSTCTIQGRWKWASPHMIETDSICPNEWIAIQFSSFTDLVCCTNLRYLPAISRFTHKIISIRQRECSSNCLVIPFSPGPFRSRYLHTWVGLITILQATATCGEGPLRKVNLTQKGRERIDDLFPHAALLPCSTFKRNLHCSSGLGMAIINIILG